METAEIKLLGQRIPLKVRDSDPELTSEVIALVGKRVAAAEKRFRGTPSAHEVTLLALLDLAEEYVLARRRTVEYQADVEGKAAELARLIEAGDSSA